MIWHYMIWYHLIWYDIIWWDMTWYDIYGMIWHHDIIWFYLMSNMICFYTTCIGLRPFTIEIKIENIHKVQCPHSQHECKRVGRTDYLQQFTLHIMMKINILYHVYCEKYFQFCFSSSFVSWCMHSFLTVCIPLSTVTARIRRTWKTAFHKHSRFFNLHISSSSAAMSNQKSIYSDQKCTRRILLVTSKLNFPYTASVKLIFLTLIKGHLL